MLYICSKKYGKFYNKSKCCGINTIKWINKFIEKISIIGKDKKYNKDSKEIKEQYDNIFKKFISYVKNIKKINKIDLQKLR